ncbi:MAG: class I SAM-dependent methyltransferase [Alphaproteobacteria bacterium]|nr:class I SAM-dependent methyltransferase [Alphaproteobacteria bacterium]
MKQTFKRLEMIARGLVPGKLKSAVRIARSAVITQPLSKEMSAELVDGAEIVASRGVLIERMKKGAIAAELGTYRGDFTRQMLARAEPEKLHVIDVDYTKFDSRLLDDPRVVKHEGLTHQVMATFEDGFFDWVYIDADHSYSGALRDAEASAPKVRPGGYLIFNDFAHIDPYLGRYGVHCAVVDFMEESRWPMRYLAMHPAALYDVALQKPSTGAAGKY